MRDDELTYDWLELLAEQKSAARSIIKEVKASQTNPKAAAMFGDYDYVMAGGDSIKIIGSPPPMSTARLFCTAQNRIIQNVQFHAKFITNLENAYRQGSVKYCPMSAGGFNPRKVRNNNSLKLPPEQRSLSNHSFGSAIDFNPGKNPFRKGFTSEVEGFPEFIAAFEKNGFTWLGDGVGRQGPGHPGDDMHFEISNGGESAAISLDSQNLSIAGGDAASFLRKFGTQAASGLAAAAVPFIPGASSAASGLAKTFFKESKNNNKKKLLKENIVSVPNSLNRQPRNQRVVGIVIHHSNTNDAKTTLRVLQQRGYSTNYEVDQKGNIYQYINPDEGYALATGAGANKHTVAIDVTTGRSTWPPEQVQAVKTLVNSIAQKYGFQLKLAPDQGPADWAFWQGKGFTLFRHRNFVATQCPSTFPMEQIAGPAPAINLNIPGASFGASAQGGDIVSMLRSFGTNAGAASTAAGAVANAAGGTLTRVAQGVARSFTAPAAPTTPTRPMRESIDKKIFIINDETPEKIYKKNKKYFESLLKHLKKELKITKAVKINFIEDKKNSENILGKTGSYINHKDEINVYSTGRHIKDIMRSLSHELVHHRQNIRGDFEDHHLTKHGYAQTDKHLRAMEKEAYLKGNMLFRDWEDNYKYRGER